jgi:hypothetical protein
LLPLVTLPLAVCLACASRSQCQEKAQAPATTKSASSAAVTPAQSSLDQQREETDRQARPEVEKQRLEAEQQAQKSLDKEAIAAIQETQTAVRAIAAGKTDEALAAIERATGKIDVLVARNPATALLPAGLEVKLIDAAPEDIQAIKGRASAAQQAVDKKDFPTARLLLAGLTSEIRVRTINLPLATYPTALKEAARMLDKNQTNEAKAVLMTALNTLVMIDRITPLPIALAQDAIKQAEARREKDKEGAISWLNRAKREIERAQELGYAGNDPEYDSLSKAIAALEKQLHGKEDTTSAFTSLLGKVAAFFKGQSETERR